eukprot:421925-Pelagomonas_calceolata.AAC.1
MQPELNPQANKSLSYRQYGQTAQVIICSQSKATAAQSHLPDSHTTTAARSPCPALAPGTAAKGTTAHPLHSDFCALPCKTSEMGGEAPEGGMG